VTRDQRAILKVLRHQRRLKVSGGAGTGKTWLALEQAKRLSKAGEKVALVSYSRGLARFFQRVTAAWPKAERPAYVGLFHSLPLAWGADQPPPEDDAAARTDYDETSLPKQMGDLAAQLPDSEKFDSIVVDEGQDFGDVWWPPTVACLRDAETGGLFVFFDEAQRVFNIRNTKKIAQVFGSLAGAQMKYRGLDGPPMRFMPCDPAAAIECADDAVEWLLEQGWSDGLIAVLTTGRRHYVQTPSTDEEWAAYWDAFFDNDEVFYGHVLGFKGLERPAVVLAVNGNRDPARAKEMLYVGLSRARTQLIVCGDLDMITEMGGPAVRIRLLAGKGEQGGTD
jgi:superfamily I DNA/RNA helicase